MSDNYLVENGVVGSECLVPDRRGVRPRVRKIYKKHLVLSEDH